MIDAVDNVALRGEFRAFAATAIAPHADRFDRQEALDSEAVAALAASGYFGAAVPETFGGRAMSAAEFGALNEEFGRVCSSVRSVVTVHSMVSAAIARWGSIEQQHAWLSRLAAGASIGAFALSEPAAGSDVDGIETIARRCDDGYVLNGRKKWITAGQLADVFLTFTKVDGRSTAFLVDRCAPGLAIRPMGGLLGVRASMLAELEFRNCTVPAAALIGRVGFGMAAVGSFALDLGRYSVAWGCVGMSQACLDASLAYAGRRRQSGKTLAEHQLIKRRLTNMIANVTTARLACMHAARLREAGSTDSIIETCLAKYVSARASALVSASAIQIHGAAGCGDESPVARHLRDAQVMQIIEGSSEIHQQLIADHALRASTSGEARRA